MDIKNFIYLIEVAESGSISKAAENLYISQPYLSKLIREIEENFKINIFLRTTKGVELTFNGQKFIKQAKILLREYYKFSDISHDANSKKKVFSLSTVRSSLAVEAFIRLTNEYSDQGIEFTIRESGGMTPLEDVYLLKSDMAVIYTQSTKKDNLLDDLKRRGITYTKINDLRSCIVLRKNHPLLLEEKEITLDKLESYGLILYDNDVLTYDNSNTNQNIYNFVKEKLSIKSIVNVTDRSLLHNLLINTDYFSLGTTPAKDQEDLFGIVSIPHPSLHPGYDIEMGTIQLRRNASNPIAKRLVEILLETYG